jgi:signal transduction histidine kinase
MSEELLRLAARGALASAITAELAGPLDRVARVLEATVDRLDRHVATSRGPEPLPYAALGEVRERVAEAFLDIGRLARLAADLALVAASSTAAVPAAVDLNDLVERALSLARHRFDPDTDVHLDLGSLPAIELDAVRMVQVVAHLLVEAAGVAGAGATVEVSTSSDDREVHLRIAYPGARAGEGPYAAVVAADLDAEGGRLAYTTDGERTLAVLSFAARK